MTQKVTYKIYKDRVLVGIIMSRSQSLTKPLVPEVRGFVKPRRFPWVPAMMDNPPQGWPAWTLLCTHSSTLHLLLQIYSRSDHSYFCLLNSANLQNYRTFDRPSRKTVFCDGNFVLKFFLKFVTVSVHPLGPIINPDRLQGFHGKFKTFFSFFNLNFSPKFQNVRPSRKKLSFPRVKKGFSSSSSS